MSLKYLIWTCGVCIYMCLKTSGQEPAHNLIHQTTSLIHNSGNIIRTRFLTPEGFERVEITKNSFAQYLRELPLKPSGAKVHLYDGRTKENAGVYDAVINLSIGTKDLHQCADAVMRLRAEYLFQQQQYDKIHFNFTNGFRVDYSEWMQGKRIKIQGNKTWWVQFAQPSNTIKDFWNYMEIIFTYAGTLSLSKELEMVSIENLAIGDVFIRGGSPGHAVIVVDMAVNPKTEKKIFLLAQSYMPAQELQVLKNPDNAILSPWYSSDFGEILQTPEWTFRKTELMRFREE